MTVLHPKTITIEPSVAQNVDGTWRAVITFDNMATKDDATSSAIKAMQVLMASLADSGAYPKEPHDA